MKRIVKSKEGITLIALIITIIVLLILAGVTVNLTLGENGLLKRAGESREEYTKSSIQEELDLTISDLKIKKIGKSITDEEIEEKLKEIGVIVLDKTGGIIIGEYKDYEIQIDENRKVTIGEKLTGARPTGTVNILTKEEGVDKVELQVVASITDGEIESIEAMDGAVLKSSADNSATEKIFEVTKNGEYRFKIIGTNKRIAIVSTKVSGIIELSDLLKEIEKIEHSGVQNVKMNIKTTNGTIAEKSYSLNVIRYKGDLELDGVNQVEGATLSNNTYKFGSVEDIGTASSVAKNAVVFKVEGNLTVKEGIKVAPITSQYGGPKGFFIYCTGAFINYGIVENNYGATSSGEDVYLWMNESNHSYEFIPASGASGVDSVTHIGGQPQGFKAINGKAGFSGKTVASGNGSVYKRATGGGGSGGCALAQSTNSYTDIGRFWCWFILWWRCWSWRSCSKF